MRSASATGCGRGGHAFDVGPGRGVGGSYSTDAHYLEAPPPASFPREAQYGKDGRAVTKLTRAGKGMPDADEDDHSVESLMRHASKTEDLPLPNTVQRLVAEAGNRAASRRKRGEEVH
jgi:hypothetical protein